MIYDERNEGKGDEHNRYFKKDGYMKTYGQKVSQGGEILRIKQRGRSIHCILV
jgi:ribosomal protein L27